MKLSRKTFLDIVAGAGALPILNWSARIRSALALDYPTRPVHIIVGFPAGTSSDITARLVAQRLSEQLGQQFVVENRTRRHQCGRRLGRARIRRRLHAALGHPDQRH
jgi:16S rRNA G966 N2-methylase RsmD